jgi:hypothetical protein
VGALAIRFGYIEIIKFLKTKIALSCKASTCVQVFFVCDRLSAAEESRHIYEGQYTIGGYDERYFLSNMDDNIIYGSGAHHRPLRRFAIALINM